MTPRKYTTDASRLSSWRSNGLAAVANKTGIHAVGVAAQGGEQTYRRKSGIFSPAFNTEARNLKAIAAWPPWMGALGRHRRFHVIEPIPLKNRKKPCLFCTLGEERAKECWPKGRKRNARN